MLFRPLHLAVLAAVTVPTTLRSQDERATGGVGLSVWREANFRGQNATFRTDVPDLGRYNFRRSISSLRVGSGEFWEVCEEVNYRGRCQVFSGSETDLDRNGWNDRIASARRVRDFESGSGGGSSATGDLILSASTSWRGEQRRFSSAVSSLRSHNWDNRARSLQVMGGSWEICHDANFGRCRTVQGTVRDLSQVGYSGSISSIRPSGTGGGESGGGGGDETIDAARQACANELSRHGWSVARPAASTRSGILIVLEQEVRGTAHSQRATARCTYDPRARTVQVRF